MLGVHWSRDFHPAQAARPHGGSPNMTYHGGKIMPTAVSTAIWWGTSWATYSGDKITGIDSWYSDHSGSNYANTVNEYTGTNGQVGSTLTHQGHLVDPSVASGGNRTSVILAEVCKQVSQGHLVPDPSGNGYYPVYSDVKRGNGYCATHSGSCTVGTTTVPGSSRSSSISTAILPIRRARRPAIAEPGAASVTATKSRRSIRSPGPGARRGTATSARGRSMPHVLPERGSGRCRGVVERGLHRQHRHPNLSGRGCVDGH
jgi:hypothetical protein